MAKKLTGLELSELQIKSIGPIIETAVISYLQSRDASGTLAEYIESVLLARCESLSLEDTSDQSFQLKAATYLYDKLKAKRKIIKKPNINGWAGQVKKFLRDSGVPQREFKQVLQWFCENMSDPYMPRVFSMTTFIEKYVRIADAKDRQEHQQNKNQPQTQDVPEVKTRTVNRQASKIETIVQKVTQEYQDVGCSSQFQYDRWVKDWEAEQEADWLPPGLTEDEWLLYKRYRKKVRQGEIDEINVV